MKEHADQLLWLHSAARCEPVFAWVQQEHVADVAKGKVVLVHLVGPLPRNPAGAARASDRESGYGLEAP